MSGCDISFSLPGFEIDEVIEEAEQVIVCASACNSTAVCPKCGICSERVHSYYQRQAKTLPCIGRSVQLRLRVRRFRCLNQACQQQTFAEQHSTLVERKARRTQALSTLLKQLSFALGGEGTARISALLQVRISADTCLRLLRKTVLPEYVTPQVLGVDDWAIRKGRKYGTILVDLEAQQPIELLPDREASSLAAWLKAHPGVQIISRDRGGAYAEGARLGAPDAIQVADRWHLLKNLRDALALSYERYPQVLKQLIWEPEITALPQVVHEPVSAPAQQPRKASPKQLVLQQRRQHWEQKFTEVHTLKSQGCSIRQIMKQTGLCRRTVRKYLNLTTLPVKTSPKPGTRLIEPFRDYLLQRLAQGHIPYRQLLEELRTQGFTGSLATLHDGAVWARHLLGQPSPRPTRAAKPPTKQTLSARALSAFVLCQPATLSEQQLKLLHLACELHADVRFLTETALEFVRMLRERDVTRLDAWLHTTRHATDFPALVSLARGLSSDYAAVRAGLSLPYSNGQVEGQITRLKLLKRQMYGRSNFDLLRIRVLSP